MPQSFRHAAPGTARALHKMHVIMLSVLLICTMTLPYIGVAATRPALASGQTVNLWKEGNIHYSDGAWNAHIFHANDGEGETLAYCIEPAKNSPSEGSYEKSSIHCVSGRDYELIADLWFAFGGPGFDASMWPATNWNGDPMGAEDYYLASHILLADTYSSSAHEATYGAGENFRNWLTWNITGFDLNNGSLINPNALGRLVMARTGEVPADFEAYMIDGGSKQTIAASSRYKTVGMIKMNKRSMNPDITNDNPLYSMEGITYGVYVTNTCGPEGDTGKTLVLDESGYAEVGGLYSSTYFIREIESSVEGTGYAYDPTIYSCWVNPGEVSWLHDTSNGAGDVDQNDVTDEPQTEDVDVIIQKHDLLTQSSTSSGDGILADALFEVRYFPNLMGETGGNAARRWTFRTDNMGKVDLRGDLSHAFVSGDALYRDPITNEPLFPIGTYAIRELKAPASYEVPVDNGPIVITITAHGTGAHDVSSGPLGNGGVIVNESPIRQDLCFTKRDLDTQRPMDGIPFLVSRIATDGSTIERHVVVTDANGRFDSNAAHRRHTTRTNANDAAVEMRADGSYVVNEALLDSEAGTWFGMTAGGSMTAANDSVGAFPDSTTCHYVFEELPVRANEGKALVQFEAFAHAAQSTKIDLGTVGNTTPTLATSAFDARDGDKLVSWDENAVILDSVSYSGLVAGRTYTLEGYLADATTGEALRDPHGNAIASSHTFTASACTGNVEVRFVLNTMGLQNGRQLVVCERLLENGRLLATHEDINDSSQTVTVVQPAIETRAVDGMDGDSLIVGDIDATIVDHVSYTGLVPGASYELTGTIVDSASGLPFESSGSTVTSTVVFVPEASSGSIDIAYALDASELEPGTKLVVFEKLVSDGTIVATHEDLDSVSQTVSVFPPSLQTHAHDPQDGDSSVASDIATSIIDTVSYSGLTPGYEYSLEATLVDKESGRPALDPFGLPVTATHVFTPQEREGSTDVVIDFDATNIQVSTAFVVFEELYRDGRHLARHVDLRSAEQTIVVEPPYIQTAASSDGTSKQLMRDRDVSLVDAVAYRNLKAGQSYELRGCVMNKATGEILTDREGNPVKSSLEFTPDAPSGLVELFFTLDATVVDDGTELVVFEELYRNGIKVAAHEDLANAQQTVTVAKPRITTMATSKDGSKTVVRDVDTTIVDTVSYEGLAPHCNYTLFGTVMSKANGKPLIDEDGRPITSQADFVTDHADGTVSLSFSLDTSMLETGSELVIFEKLFRNGEEITIHEDIEDEGQTVRLVPAIINTYASDPLDGGKLIAAHEQTRVFDAVSYEGLQPGVTYEFVGTLMDKEAEAPLLTAQGNPVQATCSFVPEEAAGTVDVSFSFDASSTDTEREIVIFEELYRNGRLLATHADYENTAQTVRITPPSIKTYAADASDGDKEISEDCVVTIIDNVSYAGLIPNEKYEIDGVLMIDDGTLEGKPALDAFGRPIAAHVAFTPDSSHGNINVPFEIDATLLGDDTKLVVFEKLFANDALMAEHADLHDENQTVRAKPSKPDTPPEEASPPNESAPGPFGPSLKTGDATIWMLAACGLIGTAAFGLLAMLRRKAFGSMHDKR